MATGLPDFELLLREALSSVAVGSEPSALISQLRATVSAQRALERVRVGFVASLLRSGEFAARGYKKPESALANLLDISRGEARQLVVAAESVCPRVALQGETVEPALPATAAVFAGGEISVRHVAAIASVLGARAAQRLAPHEWAHAEEHVAKLATLALPKQLFAQANEYIELLDQDGEPPSERPPGETNELRYTRHPRGGGKIIVLYDDPVRFETILAVIDAKSAPLTADDDRTAAERQ